VDVEDLHSFAEEIAHIDFLLAELQESVERGEIGRVTLDQMSARYLARRARLQALLVNATAEAAAEQAASPPLEVAPPAEAEDALALVADSDAEEEPVPALSRGAALVASVRDRAENSSAAKTAAQADEELDRVFDRGAPPGEAPWADPPSASLSLGRLIAYVGASLVVVAAAVFGIRGWFEFPPIVPLAGLTVATIVLYFDGEWARKQLSLPTVGAAMIAGAALLFVLDGYAALQWLGVTGPLPWAAVLLACSLGYWVTEVRIGGSFFGSAGAVAQTTAFVLVANALHWSPSWTIATVGLLAAAWALGARAVNPEGPYVRLAHVLGPSSLVLSAIAAVASAIFVAPEVAGASSSLPILAAGIVALACSIAAESVIPEWRAVSVIGQLGVFLAAGALHIVRSNAVGPVGFDLLAMVFLLSFANMAYSIRKGSWTFAVSAYLSWCLAWTGVALQLHFNIAEMTGGTALLGVIILGMGLAAKRSTESGSMPQGGQFATFWQIAGPLTTISAAVVAAPQCVSPLVTHTSTIWLAGYAVLAAWVMLMLYVAHSLRARNWTGGAVVVWSFFLALSLMLLAMPSWPVARYGVGLVVLALAWSLSRDIVDRLCIKPHTLVLFCEALYVIIPVGALAMRWGVQSARTYDFAALLAASAIAFASEAIQTRERHTLALAPVFSIAAIAGAIWTGATAEAAAIAGGVTALVIAAVSLFARVGRQSWATTIVLSSGVTASLLAVAVIRSPQYLLAQLLLLSLVWALLSRTTMIPEIAGASAGFAVLAVAAALWWLNGPLLLTVATLTGAAVVLFLPRLIIKQAPSHDVARLCAALATAGLLSLGVLDTLGLASYVRVSASLGPWAALGGVGLGVALALTGVYVIVWTIVEKAELGLYVGFWLIVLCALVQLDAARVRFAEPYLLAVALFFGLGGMYWSSRKSERPMPAGSDLAAMMLAAFAPLIVSLGSTSLVDMQTHGAWTLGLSLVVMLVGLALRARIYLIGGFACLVVELLWLSRSMLWGLPSWLWIAAAVGVVAAAGLLFNLRHTIAKIAPRYDISAWR
jgi:hypothetical protein